MSGYNGTTEVVSSPSPFPSPTLRKSSGWRHFGQRRHTGGARQVVVLAGTLPWFGRPGEVGDVTWAGRLVVEPPGKCWCEELLFGGVHFYRILWEPVGELGGVSTTGLRRGESALFEVSSIWGPFHELGGLAGDAGTGVPRMVRHQGWWFSGFRI